MTYSAPYILPAMSSGYRPERVKILRARLGMTQKQLAEAAGTSQGDISRIERGETGVTADDAKRGRIARALGTTVDDIYDGVGAIAEITVHREVDAAPGDAHAIFDAALLRAVGVGVAARPRRAERGQRRPRHRQGATRAMGREGVAVRGPGVGRGRNPRRMRRPELKRPRISKKA